MSTKKPLRYLSGLLLSLIALGLLAACGDSPTATPAASTTAAATTAAATSASNTTGAAATTQAASGKWSLAAAAAPYKGQKVTLATVSWKEATLDLAKEFTQQTGIELEVVQLPNADLL